MTKPAVSGGVALRGRGVEQLEPCTKDTELIRSWRSRWQGPGSSSGHGESDGHYLSVVILLLIEGQNGRGMAEPSIEDRVVKLVEDHWAAANVRAVQINNRFPEFVRGTLYFVSIYDANNTEHENYVYAVGSRLTLFKDINQLAIGVGKTSSAADTLQGIIQFGGISGLIALIITATICYRTFQGDLKFPDVLGHALSTILGFYFGSALQNASKK